MDPIYSLRSRKVSEIKREIDSFQKSINNINGAIIRIKSEPSFSKVYVDSQISKRNDRIQSYSTAISSLTDKIERIDNGELDDEIKFEIEDRISKHSEEERKRKVIEEKRLEREKEAKEILNRKEERVWKDYDREYNYLEYITESLPPYMKKNLSEMPNNKGYIHRGVWFYGHKDSEDDNYSVMFEKLKDEVMIIHEWNDGIYSKYYKKGKTNKVKIN